jgi:hypothetical protein
MRAVATLGVQKPVLAMVLIFTSRCTSTDLYLS